ncbi:putative amino-acid permease [Pseudocercospora fuligena]|uniref:Putative amino-acid permease n=1 Tax=Pseudocercospora fuligena TaxID=685502 RepID=A0A8H6RBS6_9PEZI|nr:putative amino-acid permease [Pseudocercospora fuligena]
MTLRHGDVELTTTTSESSLPPTKTINTAILKTAPDDSSSEDVPTNSTFTDTQNMLRMGKRQELVRSFRLLSIAAFTAIATAAWELGLFLLSPGLINGGRSGLIYSTLWNFLGFLPVYLSMAEMASIAPIAGAQYHWVSEFAPEKYQKVLSYMTGWTSTIAWQAGNAMGVILTGTLIQSIILVNDEEYGFENWQGTLLAIAVMAVAYIVSVYGHKSLPKWQLALFGIHVAAYFGYLVPVWINAPKATHTEVWSSFSNSGGWSSTGLAVLVGQLPGISQQIGIDTAAHMSEEVRDAAYTVPRAMLFVYIFNMVIIFPGILTVCYHIPDLDAALDDPTTYPAIYVLRQAMSTGWMTVVLAITVFILMASNVVYLAAVTRDLYAFARDHGLPFSG